MGKSTVGETLKSIYPNMETISLDDFYLPYKDRLNLDQKYYPYRGPPGTHDV